MEMRASSTSSFDQTRTRVRSSPLVHSTRLSLINYGYVCHWIARNDFHVASYPVAGSLLKGCKRSSKKLPINLYWWVFDYQNMCNLLCYERSRLIQIRKKQDVPMFWLLARVNIYTVQIFGLFWKVEWFATLTMKQHEIVVYFRQIFQSGESCCGTNLGNVFIKFWIITTEQIGFDFVQEIGKSSWLELETLYSFVYWYAKKFGRDRIVECHEQQSIDRRLLLGDQDKKLNDTNVRKRKSIT